MNSRLEGVRAAKVRLRGLGRLPARCAYLNGIARRRVSRRARPPGASSEVASPLARGDL